MRKYYISKNYSNVTTAGNKAKTDIEAILVMNGYKNAGLQQTHIPGKIKGFLRTLLGVLKLPFSLRRGGILVLQYPLKKYYNWCCRMAHLRGCKVVTVIHDLGAFRRKKLTISQEMKKLHLSDYLIVHNRSMEKWLLENGYKHPMGRVEIFDYLSDTTAVERPTPRPPYRVVYAGGLGYRKNPFLFDVPPLLGKWSLMLYGFATDLEKIEDRRYFHHMGFVPSDQLVERVEGDFGLVWDGDSAETCTGAFGEYLRYNNPHKTPLYIRCQLPIIIWSEAAMAPFVLENGIGITVDSLALVGDALDALSPEEYTRMKENTKEIGRKLSQGYYFSTAFAQAEQVLSGKK